MKLDIENKVAVVSAATQGIGFECALGLAREGARVAMFSRDAARLREAAAALKSETGASVFTRAADLFDADSIRAFFAAVKTEVGPAQILVANSVGPPPGTFEAFSDLQWAAAFEGAFLSTVRLVREALPQMREAGGGAVVAIQSNSVRQPIPGLSLSNGVRPGVAGLMKSLAAEYGAHGIRFNVVCPGRIMTERFLTVEKSHGEPLDERIARMAAEVPLRRLGVPAEVADAALFLCSARAAYITGTVLSVDGGNLKGIH
ncbi:MAG: SDR family oxidoreductase [Burkholderiaceae bacterium]|nr:SDR family oxidoreductase [Burkholderiaceae bacterium]